MRLNSGGGIDDESIEVIEYDIKYAVTIHLINLNFFCSRLSIESAKAEMCANDEETGIGRTSGFRFAICWFNFVKYPQMLSTPKNKLN